MPNPLLGDMNPTPSPAPAPGNSFAPLKNALSMLNSAKNPQQVLQQLAQKDPKIAQVIQLVQGKNPQQVFYAMCQQRGVDPNTILNQLK